MQEQNLDPILDIRAAAAYLKVSRVTLYRKRRLVGLQEVKRFGKIGFRKSELDRFLAEGNKPKEVVNEF